MINSVWKVTSMCNLDISPKRDLFDKDELYSDLKQEKVLDEGYKKSKCFYNTLKMRNLNNMRDF